MVRNARVEEFDTLSCPIVALGNEYADGHVIPPHHHAWSQLLVGATGAVVVATLHGSWVVPPQRGMWIPAGVMHDVRMLGAVSMRSLYLAPDAAEGMPARCQV